MSYLVGVDIGGTFTDCAIVDRAGKLLTTKVPSTPPDFSRGMMDALDSFTRQAVGTRGVRPRSRCQIAAYRVPSTGAVVVVVGWKTPASAGGRPKPGRAPLRALRRVTRPSFECFRGRGAAATVELHGRVFQVNVMVGDRASPRRVDDALAVGRSFALAR